MTDTSRSGGAGWYPDPSGAPRARWWDGARWTTHTSPLPPGAGPEPVGVAGPTLPRRRGAAPTVPHAAPSGAGTAADAPVPPRAGTTADAPAPPPAGTTADAGQTLRPHAGAGAAGGAGGPTHPPPYPPDPATPEAVADRPHASGRAGGRLWAKVLLGVAGLVLVAFAGRMALAGTGADDAGDGRPTATARTSPPSTSVTQPTTTTTPTTSSTVPIAPPDQGPELGSRERMAAAGQVIRLFDTDDGNYDVTIAGFWADAAAAVAAADPLNDPAPAGSHYALVKLAATYHAGLQKRTGSVFANLDAAVFGASGTPIADRGCGVEIPERLDPFLELADGGVTVGNLCFLLPDAEVAGPVVVRVAEAFCFANCDAAWFRVQ